MPLAPHPSPLGIYHQGVAWMEISPHRNGSSMLKSRSVCTVTLPGLCLAGWFGFPSPLAMEEHSPDMESGLVQSHRHGWMPRHMLRCIDVLETRCSNQLHQWTHERVSRARPANVTAKKGVEWREYGLWTIMERLRRKVKLKFISFSYSGFLLPLLGSMVMFRAGRYIAWICPWGSRLRYGTRVDTLQS